MVEGSKGGSEGRVFVMEGIVRESLALARSLGRYGLTVDIGDPYKINPARFSKYVDRFYQYPDPKASPQGFYDWLLDHVKTHRYDMIFPVNDFTFEPCTRHQEELERYTRIGANSLETFLLTRDKSLTYQKAVEADVPIPRTWVAADIAALEAMRDDIDLYPVIAKPSFGSGARGFRILADFDAVADYVRHAPREGGATIIQDYIPGDEIIDVPVVYNQKGEFRAALVNNRVRTYPQKAGVNVFGHAVDNKPAIETSKRLFDHLGWKGIGLAEYKRDPRDGVAKLIEINPRWMGSTQLGISAGVDWPRLLYQSVVEGDCETVTEYRTDRYLRWLIPGDLLHFLTAKERSHLDLGFFNLFDPNTEFYIWSRTDPLPTLGLLMTLAVQILNPKMVSYYFKR